MSRIRSASLNVGTTLATQIISLVLKFAVQTAFIYKLSQDYVGLNGLFSNVISFLSFADLGIGAAITVALYKPIAENDFDALEVLLHFYRRIYRVICGVMILIGAVIAPFLNLAIKDSIFGTWNIAIWFLLYLFSSVASYFSAYKRSFLMADQKGYVSSLNDFFFKMGQQLCQIFVLVFFRSFVLYLILQVLFVILSNVQLSRKVDRLYPTLFANLRNGVIRSETMLKIKNNVIGSISSKIGGIVVFGTDNLLISAFVGLGSVAKYSNYMLIIQSLNSIFSQALGAMVGSIGNLSVTSDSAHQEKTLLRLMYINAVINVMLVSGLGMGVHGFIRIWAGENYILQSNVVLIILANFLINQYRYTVQNFISGMGLYWHLRYKSIIESIVNFIVSFGLVYFWKFGISGVVLGTLVSNILVNVWWEPLIVYKYGFQTSVKKYVIRYMQYVLFSLLTLLGVMRIENIVGIESVAGLIFKVMIGTLVALGTFIAITCRTSEFLYFYSLVKNKVFKS